MPSILSILVNNLRTLRTFFTLQNKGENEMDEKNREILSSAITETIRKSKRLGTVGMSYLNLKQITPTRGLSCSVSDFHNSFDQIAADTAKSLRFNLYR
jgi:hypothetical protein